MIKLIKVISKVLLVLALMSCAAPIIEEGPPTAARAELKIGPKAHALIRKFEGFSAQAYPDMITGGYPYAYGYGFTTRADGSPVQPGDTISRKEADRRLVYESERSCGFITKSVPKSLQTQDRVDAAASFCWNIGVPGTQRSQFFKRWKAGDINGAARAMHSWVATGTPAEKVLRARRRIESALFQGERTRFDG